MGRVASFVLLLSLAALLVTAQNADDPTTGDPTTGDPTTGGPTSPPAGGGPLGPDQPDYSENDDDFDDVVSGPQQNPKSSYKALQTDAQIIADKFGWTVSATQSHLKNQYLFGFLVRDLEQWFPSKFAGSAMARYPGARATVWVKDPIAESPELWELVQQFNGQNTMKVTIIDKMKFSFVEQEGRMDDIAATLSDQGYEGIVGAIRPGDVIHLTMMANKKFPASKKPEKALELGEGGNHRDISAKRLLPGWDVSGILIEFTGGQISVEEHCRGGRQVYSATHQCTAGFAVEHLENGKNGVITAAHCSSMDNFNAESPEADFKLYHQAEHCGEYGDVEWKSSDHLELAEYWANVADLRNVASVTSSYSVSNLYCVFSRMQSSRTCDYVYSTSVSQTGTSGACNGVTARRLVAMELDSTIGGDSGAPWSVSTEASGVHKGDVELWYGMRNTFTKATQLGNALGVEIITK